MMDSPRRNFGFAVLYLAVSLQTMAAQDSQSAPKPAPQRQPARNSFLISRPVPDAAAVERGQKNFVANCGFCHGSNANGGEGGPDLIRSVLALDDDDGDKIGPVILKGRPEKGMPPFAMTSAQIKDIASFLRARQQAAINRGAYPIQNVVTGNARSGEAFFKGAGRCNTCHSPTGDFAGIGKKYEPVMLQSRMLYPTARRGRRASAAKPVPSVVTVSLPSGQSFKGTLEYLDDFNVSLREPSGDYHSFSRDPGMKVDVQDPRAAHAELVKTITDAQMHDLLAYLVTLK